MVALFPFENSYAALPEGFFARVRPAPPPAPRLVKLNEGLARELGLDPDALKTPEAAEIFAGARIPEGADPIALAYAGHQFGHFQPQLGDGRALLLGEVIDREGRRRDIQLKGSGRTPFSRMGDGKAALGPVLREYVVSEAMHALGIPTTRALAATITGEPVIREAVLPGAVLTRVAASHIRVGTFQFFAARRDVEALKRLADYAIARHYPEIEGAPEPYRAFLDAVIGRQTRLVARWLLVGFIHGVMNTDNMSISGETIDYGPCAFLDSYDPMTVFSSIDARGRYAYGNQPGIAQWNLARLAECLLPLLHAVPEDSVAIANEALGTVLPRLNAAYLEGLYEKLGLSAEAEGDHALAHDLLDWMADAKADFTLTFRRLADAAENQGALAGVRCLFADPGGFDAWAVRWQARLEEDPASPAARAAAMRRASPAVVPRNHLVEAMIAAAVEKGDFAPFEDLLRVVAAPYEEQPGLSAHYALPPPTDPSYRTFCGT